MLQQTSSSLSAFVQPQPPNLPISNPGVQTFDHNLVPTLPGASSQTAVASQPLVTSFQQPQLPPSAVTTQTIPNVIPQPPQQQQQQQPLQHQLQAPVTQLNLPQQVLSVQNQLVQHLSGQIAAQTVASNTQQLLQNISPQLMQQILQAAAPSKTTTNKPLPRPRRFLADTLPRPKLATI